MFFDSVPAASHLIFISVCNDMCLVATGTIVRGLLQKNNLDVDHVRGNVLCSMRH